MTLIIVQHASIQGRQNDHGEQKIGPKKHPNGPRSTPKRAQESPRRPKTEPKATQDDPKRSPRGQKKRSRTARRKKSRTKTIPRPSWTAQGPNFLNSERSRGAIWEAKMAPKPIPKRSKIEAKIQDEKKETQDDLGPILQRSWVDLGPILGFILANKY